MTKTKINIIMISIFTFLLIVFLFEPSCLFYKYIGFPCPSCGMTRALKYLLKGDILLTIKTNLLCIPLFAFIIMITFIYLYSLIFKKKYINTFLDKIANNYKTIIVLISINWIVNIVKSLYYL